MRLHEAREYLTCLDPGELEGGVYKADTIEDKVTMSREMGMESGSWLKGRPWNKQPRRF